MPNRDMPSKQAPSLASGLKNLLSRQGRLSLRVKGLISLIVAVGYVAATSVILTDDRLKLPSIVKDLDRLHQIEGQMAQTNVLLARAIIAASEAYFIVEGDIRTRQLFMEMAPLESALGSVSRYHEPIKAQQEQLVKLTRELAHQPSKGVLEAMHGTMHRTAQDLTAMTQSIRNEKQLLMTSYQRAHDKLTVETVFFSFLGIIIVGVVMAIFFTRLTWDIGRVGRRAMAIVKGYRGTPLELTRGDEVGELMQAINEMQSELRERERQLELSRQQQFHQEKMAAVGSLAAAVAHEINNPIMAISGLAQVILDQNTAGETSTPSEFGNVPAMILEQAKRISSITRHISEFATPQSQEPQLSDLNTIARSTANFVRFDQRYRQIDLEIHEDHQLRPVFVVGDHIAQILINLMINAADALEGVEGRQRKVIVSTTQQPGAAVLTVEDNGCGMSDETVKHACEEFYTTKPRGKGSGLGLFLSKNLLAKNEASMIIDSHVNEGTRIAMHFPNEFTAEN